MFTHIVDFKCLSDIIPLDILSNLCYIIILSVQDGMSALMFASEKGHAEIVKYLLKAKASLNLQTKVSWQQILISMLCCTVAFT